MYGGITTDQEPLEATEDYEEDKRTGDRKQLPYEDHDAADNKDINPDQAKIRVKGKTPPGAEADDVDKEADGPVGGNNPVHGEGPDRQKSDEELNFRNKHSPRHGARSMSPEEIQKWKEDNP